MCNGTEHQMTHSGPCTHTEHACPGSERAVKSRTEVHRRNQSLNLSVWQGFQDPYSMPAAPGPNPHSSDDKCTGSRGIKDSLEELIELGFEFPKA